MQWVQFYIAPMNQVKSKALYLITLHSKKQAALLLDEGLAKAMLEAEHDDEVNLEDAKKILGFRSEHRANFRPSSVEHSA